MRRQAKASSAGSTHGIGVAHRRRRSVLFAALALIACLAIGAGVASAVAPTVSIENATEAGFTTAKVKATIDPQGQPTTYRFQYISEAQFQDNLTNSLPGFEGAVTGIEESTETAETLERQLTGLTSATTYHLRIQAENGDGQVEAVATSTFPTQSATAPAPSVDTATEVAYTTAQISGTVDPEGGNTEPGGAVDPVHWQLQTSTTGDPESWGTVAEGDIVDAEAQGTAPITVPATPAELNALTPATTYHYRLLATFTGKNTASTEKTFTTEPVATPTVVLNSITTHTDTTAEFSGTVDPSAPGGSLSAAAKAAYETNWHFSCNPECSNLTVPNGTVAAEADAGEQVVNTEVTGLEPNTTYEVTLEATNAGGPDSDLKSFATDLILPTVKAAPGAADGKGGYYLQGVVNPHKSAISACEFEYGITTAYGESIPCDSDPGAVNNPVEVNAHPTGLNLGTTYHFRLVATNGAGPEESGDATFVPTFVGPAQGCSNEALRAENNSLGLAECRAYELVSNPFKEGFVPLPEAYTDDGGFAYRSTGNFVGDGMGSAFNQYVATRSTTGWATASSNPSGPTYAGGIAEGQSADLRSSLWLMRRAEDSTNVSDFYVGKPDGAFTRIGPSANPATIPPGPPGTTSTAKSGVVVGSSADLSHVLFTLFSELGYPGDTSGGISSLYEYVGTGNERPELVGVDNASQQISVTNTCANMISADGRVVFFTPSCGESAAEVWARIDGTTSIDASASECTRTAADPGGPCSGPAEDTFQGASANGSRVYFTTTQQLINGDTDQTNDLYACDIPPGTPAPVGLTNPCSSLTEVSGAVTGADVDGVVRVSDDGSRVYVVAQGVLASNLGTNDATAVAGDHNLYVWKKDATHPQGQITFIASLGPSDADLWAAELPGRLSRRPAQTTADGRYLVFNASTQLLPTDTDRAQDVYRYDTDTGTLLRLSTDTFGTGGNEPGLDSTVDVEPGLKSSVMSADGATVVFLTEETLSPSDINGQLDVYSWHDGHVSLISSGRAFPASTNRSFAGITASGSDIFFNITARLTPADGDTTADIYDARVGGGFSFSKVQPCSGEACQPSAAGPVVAPAPSTNNPASKGNFKPKRCSKGKLLKGGKCVKKPHKKHQKRGKGYNKREGHNHGGGK